MLRSSMLVASALVLAPSVSLAQMMPGDSPSPRAVKVEMVGDRSVTGVLALDDLKVDCDLGLYRIRAEKIESVQFTPEKVAMDPAAQNDPILIPAMVATRTGETIAGSLRLEGEWALETELGSLTLDPSRLQKLTFTGEPVTAAVTGKVFFKGEPLAGEVVLHPRDGDAVTAPIDAQGSFSAKVPAGPLGVSLKSKALPDGKAQYQAIFRADAFGPNRIEVMMPGGMGGMGMM